MGEATLAARKFKPRDQLAVKLQFPRIPTKVEATEEAQTPPQSKTGSVQAGKPPRNRLSITSRDSEETAYSLLGQYQLRRASPAAYTDTSCVTRCVERYRLRRA